LFIEEYLTDYYEDYSGETYEFGNIYHTHSYYPHENLEFFRPVQFADKATATQATHFNIQTTKPFQQGHTLHDPPLRSDEEFLVIRAKIRPVVLIFPQVPIEGIAKLPSGSPVWRKRCSVGQIFSLHHRETKELKQRQTFIDRIKELEFPHLCFLPAGGPLEVDSVLRLDECQYVFTPHLQRTGVRLGPDLTDLLRSQVISFLTGKPTGAYEMYRRDIVEQKAKAASK
jgi:hypothetical protein